MQAERFGVLSEYAEVPRMDLTAVPKLLETSEGTFRGKTVVLATGADPRTLGVAGESELLGRGVAYCAACDGMFLRRPAAACFSLSRNKLKRAKSPMLQGFSHALVRFGGKQKAPERSPRCPHLHLVHFAPILPGPLAYEFCVFSHERGHRSSVDFTTEK